MRRVRVLFADDRSPHVSGDIVSMDDAEAAARVEIGHVEYVDTAADAETTAAAAAPETTATRTRRPPAPAGRKAKR